MKKNVLLFGAAALLAGIALSACEFSVLEDGIGTVKLVNNSSNVIVVYWSIEKSGAAIWEGHGRIYPGQSAAQSIDSSMGIKVYVEDDDGWLSKASYTVKKDETVTVRFPGDFSPEY